MLKLPKTFAFLFFFESDSSYMIFHPDSKVWMESYRNDKEKLNIKKYEVVPFHGLEPGVFVHAGPYELIVKVGAYMEEEMRKGKMLEEMDTSMVFREHRREPEASQPLATQPPPNVALEVSGPICG